MKRLILTALFAIGITCAYAQITEPLPKIDKKPLNLAYLGKDSSSVLERIKNSKASGFLNLRENADETATPELQLKPTMPIVQPDTSIRFPILAYKPSEDILHHLLVKMPD
ncbi:hypothetical protein [Pontibacter oryzae]|uniref:Uncharacterized protein n=1 Tax=Pontibacter oryzae TaxID=2304593 RepID=A0A399RYI3_9BACT|nr:hypothetical protein [Pontibacter oryzae]RIJ37030.1 hypothetical protein D1627_14570 [Pontibacter oryzae]